MKKFYVLLFLSAALSFNSSAQLAYKDVAGIFYNRCTSCHHQGGGGPFSLMDYNVVYPNASLIKGALENGKMPPWPPDTLYTRFLHERIITQTEKNDIISWIDNGAPAGDLAQVPPAPVYSRYKIQAKPDLILQIPTFVSNATTNDAYNCFALPTGLSTDRIIRAFEIVPGNPNIVHHVVVTQDSTGTANSDTQGGDCYNQPGTGIGGWAPGSPPSVFPGHASLKMGMKLKVGAKVILQTHYPVGSAGQVDSTQIRFYFYPQGETGIRPVYSNTFLQNWQLAIPAGTVKTFTAKYPAPLGSTFTSPISVFATSPHAHKINTSMVVYGFNSAADTIPLVRIPKWDFGWQGLYVHPKMVKIPAGYNLGSRHVYDNTLNNPNNPNNPPVYVGAGTSTGDEMLFDSFEWLNYQTGDENIDIGDLLSGDTLLSTSVNEVPVSHAITSYVYPNPVTEKATLIVMSERAENCEIKMFDIYGKEVAMDITRNADSFTIRRGEVPSGVYFYSLTAGKFTGSGRIILMPNK